jgi:hypothetical protein
MVFKATFSYIMVVSFIAGENHRPAASHWQTYHIKLYQVHRPMSEIQTHNVSGDRN